MINIILAEDHIILRDGIKALLSEDPELNIIGEASNGKEVIKIISSQIPDVLLVDINMPEMDGIATAKYIQENHSDIKVVMLSMMEEEKYVSKCFEAGALGYILKTTGKDELIFAIKKVAAGEPYISHRISLKMIKKMNEAGRFLDDDGNLERVNFTDRETQVLDLIAEGFTNVEIADKIFTSKRTVESHRKSLMEKTGTKNTASLIKFAIINGLIRYK